MSSQPPKRPPTAYFKFRDGAMRALRDQGVTEHLAERAKQMWDQLPQAERQSLIEESEREVKQWREANEQWKAAHPGYRQRESRRPKSEQKEIVPEKAMGGKSKDKQKYSSQVDKENQRSPSKKQKYEEAECDKCLLRVRDQLLGIISLCSKCNQPFNKQKKMMVVCRQEHYICQECISKLEVRGGQKRCPICQQVFRVGDQRVSRTGEQLINMVLPQCNDLVSLGRQGQMAYEEAQEHLTRRRIQYLGQGVKLEDAIKYFKGEVVRQISSQVSNKQFIGLGNITQVDGFYEGRSKLDILNSLGVSVTHVSAFDLLSFCCMLNQSSQSAYAHKEWYTIMLNKHPDRVQLIFGRGNLYYLISWYSKATKDYLKADQLRPKCPRVVQALLFSKRELKLHESLKQRDLVKEVQLLSHANRHFAFDLLIEKKDSLTELEEVYNQDAYYLLQVAKVYMTKKKYQKCLELIHRAQKVSPNYQEVSYCLGQYHFQRKEYKQALRYLQQTMRKPGRRCCNFNQVHYLIGRCYELDQLPNRQQLALKAFIQCFMIEQSEKVSRKIAKIYYSLGKYSEALKFFKNYQCSKHKHKEDNHDIGLCYKRLGNRGEAQHFFKQSVTKDRCLKSYPLLIDCQRIFMNYSEALDLIDKWQAQEEQGSENYQKAQSQRAEIKEEMERMKVNQAAEKWQ